MRPVMKYTRADCSFGADTALETLPCQRGVEDMQPDKKERCILRVLQAKVGVDPYKGFLGLPCAPNGLAVQGLGVKGSIPLKPAILVPILPPPRSPEARKASFCGGPSQ